MAARRSGRKQTDAKAARRKATRKSSAHKRLTPSKQRRGLAGAEVALPLDAPEVAGLVAEVEPAGGAALGADAAEFEAAHLLTLGLVSEPE